MPLPVYLIHYDAPDWLRSSIDSICQSTIPVAVTVIDNGGAPDDLGVRVLRQGGNRGYTGGANAAFSDWPDGDEWIVIGSHDLHVEPDTFTLMLADAAPGVGIIGPTLTVGSSGQRDEDGEVLWLSGTCLMIRRECAEQVGWFDEVFGSYVEDVDYGYRARAAGWKIVRSEATATGIGTSLSGGATRAIRGRSIYLRYKHDGLRGAAWEVGGLVRRVVVALLRRRWSLALCLVEAIGDGVGLCVRSRRVPRRSR